MAGEIERPRRSIRSMPPLCRGAFFVERMVRDYEEAYRAALNAGTDGRESLLEVGDQVVRRWIPTEA